MTAPVKLIIAFTGGLLVGSTIIGFALHHKLHEFEMSVKEVSRAYKWIAFEETKKQAVNAYFKESADIAIWELAKLAAQLRTAADPPFYSEQARSYQLFLNSARLAKLESRRGNVSEARIHLEEARHYMEAVFPEHPTVGEDPVFTILAKCDAAQSKVP